MKIIAKENKEFTIFRFGDNEIRVIDKNGEPWFVASDVCKALGLTQTTNALRNLDEEEVALTSIKGLSKGNDQANIVSESGMYTLVLRCRDAVNKGSVPHKFRKWVTADVLPSIRKNGSYEVSRSRKSTTEERTPLRDAVNMLVSKKHLMYPEAYALVHQRFQVTSFEQLTPEQIEPAIEYVHSIILEGELLGRQEQQISLPLSYPMAYFEQYRHIVKPEELSAPWRYKPTHLRPDGDNPNPLGRLLLQLKELGYEIDAAMFQLMSMQHHLEETRRRIESIERAIRH
ncbi:Bro-N domain-containing protein [Rosenbergiella australiborealis]|uniref:BRO-N domain-containing protein n=1 Tax=Rosenbergiella australiborealis TaxID=1544696 RepID=UPI001F4DA626|nr:Bro-N domain-containing protein [Rosenbergiella australiborealis]